jgi:hypothetical protein
MGCACGDDAASCQYFWVDDAPRPTWVPPGFSPEPIASHLGVPPRPDRVPTVPSRLGVPGCPNASRMSYLLRCRPGRPNASHGPSRVPPPNASQIGGPQKGSKTRPK